MNLSSQMTAWMQEVEQRMKQLPRTQSLTELRMSMSDRNYSAPLGFCSLARSEKRRIRSIWFICEDSSIAATPLEGKRRGVLSSYVGSWV